MSVAEQLRGLVEPLLAEDGLELFDLECSPGRVVVLVDGPDGVDLDAVTRATQRISALLDREDPIAGRYLLEVSSPGLERPLRTPTHFLRSIGSVVSVKTRPGVEGDRRVQGELTAADDEGFTVDGRRFLYDEVERVRTVFEWGPPARPPKPRRTPTQKQKASAP
jgi:ribosome maturation factor RimP